MSCLSGLSKHLVRRGRFRGLGGCVAGLLMGPEERRPPSGLQECQAHSFAQWRRELLTGTSVQPDSAAGAAAITTYNHLNIYRFSSASAPTSTIHSSTLKDYLNSLSTDTGTSTRILSSHWTTYEALTETHPPISASPRIIVAVGMTVPTDDPAARAGLDHWYAEEHNPAQAVVHGWKTAMRLIHNGHQPRSEDPERKSDSAEASTAPFLAIHEWDGPNGLGGEIWKKASQTPGTQRVTGMQTAPMQRRVRRSSYIHTF